MFKKKNYIYEYSGFPRYLIKEKKYSLFLKRPSNNPRRAIYIHTSYDDNGNILLVRYTNILGKPRPLNINDKESLVFQAFNENGVIREEGYAAHVWCGLFKKEWIISKINYYDDKGCFIESDSFLTS